MKTDEICERYAARRVNLTVRLLEDDDGTVPPDPHVLIEGPGPALRMLAELLLAVADEPENDGFGISPVSAGRAHFSERATLGVYIHRTDD